MAKLRWVERPRASRSSAAPRSGQAEAGPIICRARMRRAPKRRMAGPNRETKTRCIDMGALIAGVPRRAKAGLAEEGAIQQPSGQERQRTGHNHAGVEAEHGRAMPGDVVAPRIPHGADDAEERQRNEQVDEAEVAVADRADEEG